MKCCNEERLTPFCPMCGKQLVDDRLATLLAYVRKQAIGMEKRTASTISHNESLRELPEKQSWHEHQLDRNDRLFIPKMQAAIVKWRAWEKALEEVIAREASNGQPS